MPAKITPPSDDLTNPYGYSDMDWAAQLDPAYAAARAEVRRLSVGEDGTLSVKVKEFVVMGILASRGLQYGVEAHMRRGLAGRRGRLQCGHPGAPGPGAGWGLAVRSVLCICPAPAGHSPPTAQHA